MWLVRDKSTFRTDKACKQDTEVADVGPDVDGFPTALNCTCKVASKWYFVRACQHQARS